MTKLAQMLINNGYSIVDAAGYGTKWCKLTKDFMNSDMTLEDAPLKSIELLLIFKVAHYVTGDEQWRDEYQLLAQHEMFKYADLVASLWKRW